MHDPTDSVTSRTLLNRIRHPSEGAPAWGEFVDRYGPHILRCCRRWNLQPADAEDVAQTVLLKLAVKMREFDYDSSRSFRAWLKTVTHNAWQDFVRSRKTPGTGDSDVQRLLENQAAPQELEDSLDEEYRRALLEEAMAQVQSRVEPRTWQAFQLLALQQLPGAAVADKLGIEITAAYMMRSRVQRLLKEEVGRLGGAD